MFNGEFDRDLISSEARLSMFAGSARSGGGPMMAAGNRADGFSNGTSRGVLGDSEQCLIQYAVLT